jgi:uncharacterized protein
MRHENLIKYLQSEIFPSLSPRLYYHGPHHTMDVYNASIRICEYQQVDGGLRDLVGAAALLHDIGYIKSYKHNEALACEICMGILPQCGYVPRECEEICEMIMATGVPQNPHSVGAKILCDADLDYLGRDDFETGANNLYNEFREQKIVGSKEDWDQIQIKFISEHHYFTEFSNLYREPEKQKHLQKLINAYHNK